MNRPLPPEELRRAFGSTGSFVPAPELTDWLRSTFILPGASLENPEHRHLRFAKIGCLWTDVENGGKLRLDARGRRLFVAATAEMPRPKGSPWQKARMELQLMEWFGEVPDFLLTFYALHAFNVADEGFCALSEHELYHCGQARDEFNAPRWSAATGMPVFSMRGHDVEEFVGVTRRYGPGASTGGVQDLVQAALQEPEIGHADVALACGTCMRRAA